MINNNVEPKHLGSGVVLFESAIDLDWDYVREFSRDAINKEKEDMYTPTVNPETGDEIYLNKSGYFFQKESVDRMPGRGSAIHRYGDDDGFIKIERKPRINNDLTNNQNSKPNNLKLKK